MTASISDDPSEVEGTTKTVETVRRESGQQPEIDPLIKAGLERSQAETAKITAELLEIADRRLQISSETAKVDLESLEIKRRLNRKWHSSSRFWGAFVASFAVAAAIAAVAIPLLINTIKLAEKDADIATKDA